MKISKSRFVSVENGQYIVQFSYNYYIIYVRLFSFKRNEQERRYMYIAFCNIKNAIHGTTEIRHAESYYILLSLVFFSQRLMTKHMYMHVI